MKAIQLDWSPFRKRYFYKQANENKIKYDQEIEQWEKELRELKEKRLKDREREVEEEEVLKIKHNSENPKQD